MAQDCFSVVILWISILLVHPIILCSLLLFNFPSVRIHFKFHPKLFLNFKLTYLALVNSLYRYNHSNFNTCFLPFYLCLLYNLLNFNYAQPFNVGHMLTLMALPALSIELECTFFTMSFQAWSVQDAKNSIS